VYLDGFLYEGKLNRLELLSIEEVCVYVESAMVEVNTKMIAAEGIRKDELFIIFHKNHGNPV